MDSFGELSTCRNGGGPIPWTAIRAYAKEYGIDWYSTRVFHRVIRRMDVAYLDWVHDQSKPGKTKDRGVRREKTLSRR